MNERLLISWKILAIAVFGGYYSVIIWMCAFLLLLLVYKLSSAESKLRTLRNSQETLNDDQSSFIALLVSCELVEFYLVKALWILIAVIPISIPVLSVIFASDSSVAVSLLFLGKTVVNVGWKLIVQSF